MLAEMEDVCWPIQVSLNWNQSSMGNGRLKEPGKLEYSTGYQWVWCIIMKRILDFLKIAMVKREVILNLQDQHFPKSINFSQVFTIERGCSLSISILIFWNQEGWYFGDVKQPKKLRKIRHISCLELDVLRCLCLDCQSPRWWKSTFDVSDGWTTQHGRHIDVQVSHLNIHRTIPWEHFWVRGRQPCLHFSGSLKHVAYKCGWVTLNLCNNQQLQTTNQKKNKLYKTPCCLGNIH